VVVQIRMGRPPKTQTINKAALNILNFIICNFLSIYVLCKKKPTRLIPQRHVGNIYISLGNPAVFLQDPWLSVPASQRVWLYPVSF